MQTYTIKSNARRAARLAGLDPDAVVKPRGDLWIMAVIGLSPPPACPPRGGWGAAPYNQLDPGRQIEYIRKSDLETKSATMED